MICANDAFCRSASVSAWCTSIGGGPSTTYSLITNVRISSSVSRSMSANASRTLLTISRRSGRDGIRLLECSSVEVGSLRIAADEACADQLGVAQVDAAQVAAHEHRTAHHGAVEVRSLEVDFEQGRAGPVGARERHRGVLVAFELDLREPRRRKVGAVQLALLELAVLQARAVKAHARHADRAELAAQKRGAGEIELGEVAILRAHAMPECVLPARRAQIAHDEVGALEPALVGVAAAQVELLELDAVEIDGAQPDGRRGEPCDRAPGELVLGDQPLELHAGLHDASVGARLAHPLQDSAIFDVSSAGWSRYAFAVCVRHRPSCQQRAP